MADPTIQIPSCRGDGRCPVCEWEHSPASQYLTPPCGCACCSQSCARAHSDALLTEALRQRDAKDAAWRTAVADGVVVVEERDAERRERNAPNAADAALDAIAALCGCPEWEYPGQVIRDVEDLKRRLDAELVRVDKLIKDRHQVVEDREDAISATEHAYNLRDEIQRDRDADLARADLVLNQYVEERDAAIRERDQEHRERTVLVIQWQGAAAKAVERAERAEALLRESLPHIYPHRHPTDASDTLVARIREVLG